VSSSQQLVEPNRSGDTPPTLMIVEVAGRSQESLQKFFAEQGFRTLMTQDPQRALMRFKTWPRPDFLLISAQVLQDSAVEVFNRFSQDRYLARVPVLMIGSRSQQDFFLAEARADAFRKILLMPFKANTLLQVVRSLLSASASLDGTLPAAASASGDPG
jgi:CheY-like chemotaxis protein